MLFNTNDAKCSLSASAGALLASWPCQFLDAGFKHVVVCLKITQDFFSDIRPSAAPFGQIAPAVAMEERQRRLLSAFLWLFMLIGSIASTDAFSFWPFSGWSFRLGRSQGSACSQLTGVFPSFNNTVFEVDGHTYVDLSCMYPYA